MVKQQPASFSVGLHIERSKVQLSFAWWYLIV